MSSMSRSILPLVLFAAALLSTITAYDFGSQAYNVTLDSASPMLVYTPVAIDNGTSGWNQTYTESPWSVVGVPAYDPTLSQAPIGNGSSIQWTNTSGASVSFGFYGTGFAVLGLVYQGRSELTIDGMTISTTASVTQTTVTQTAAPISSATPTGPTSTEGSPGYDTRPILGQAQGLDMGWHQIQLTFYEVDNVDFFDGPSGMEVYGARLVMDNGQSGAATQNTTATAVTRPSGNGSLTLDFGWIWSGPWELYDYPGNISSYQAYTTTPGAVTAVSIPANTSIVLLIGSIVPPGASYGIITEVEADPSVISATGNPAYIADVTASADDANSDKEYYASMLNYTTRTDFIAQNQVLYAMQWMTGYEGTVLLNVQGQNEGQGQGQTLGGLGIDRAVFISAQGNPSTPPDDPSPSASPSSSSSSQTGAIAGGVVGGVVGLAIVGVVVWFLLRRRKRRAPKAVQPIQAEDKFDIDPVPAFPSHSPPNEADHPEGISPYVALLPSSALISPGNSDPHTRAIAGSTNEKLALINASRATPVSSNATPTAVNTPRTAGPPALAALRIPNSAAGSGTGTGLGTGIGSARGSGGDTSSMPTPTPPTPSAHQPNSAASAQPPSATALLPRSYAQAHAEDAAFAHKWEVLNDMSRSGSGDADVGADAGRTVGTGQGTARTGAGHLTLGSPIDSHSPSRVGTPAHSHHDAGRLEHSTVGDRLGYRFEQDAGRVEQPLHPREEEEVLPPNYDPAWRDQ